MRGIFPVGLDTESVWEYNIFYINKIGMQFNAIQNIKRNFKMQDLKEKEEGIELDTEAVSSEESISESDDAKRSGNAVGLSKHIVLSMIFGVLFVLAVAIMSVSVWYEKTFSLPFIDLLYIILGPVEGTGSSMIKDIMLAVLPYSIMALGLFVICSVVVWVKHKNRVWLKRGACLLCVASLVISSAYAFKAFDMKGAFVKTESSKFYEEYYIHPNSVSITASGEKRNLIYIYVESLENSHMTQENGGVMKEDYLPNLSALAKENISFSHLGEGKLGGFRSITGTGWTIAALLASTSGIPYAFPMTGNSMDLREEFAPGLTNLGDILEDNGYNQEFLCGSYASFAGRDKYFTQHGNYELFDLSTAREQGYIPEDHFVWWGYEDKYLFEIAKDEATRLASKSEPFNLTMLTVDLHSTDGYICDLCGNEYEETTANVLRCTDRLVADYIEWCKQQPFYENTTIIITGDHHRHDKAMIKDVSEEERTMYNCFINSAVEPEGAVTERVWTALDMFPTTLAAMGFEIEGDRLGLGTNMFSGEPTLAEELDYYGLNHEICKKSYYYLENFYYTDAELEAIKKRQAD